MAKLSEPNQDVKEYDFKKENKNISKHLNFLVPELKCLANDHMLGFWSEVIKRWLGWPFKMKTKWDAEVVNST